MNIKKKHFDHFSSLEMLSLVYAGVIFDIFGKLAKRSLKTKKTLFLKNNLLLAKLVNRSLATFQQRFLAPSPRPRDDQLFRMIAEVGESGESPGNNFFFLGEGGVSPDLSSLILRGYWP